MNILTMVLDIDGLTFDIEAGLAASSPWKVTNLKTDEKSVFEAEAAFFKVPCGEYRYSCAVFGVKRQVRLVAAGTRPFKLYLDGKELIDCRGDFYIPAFHRSGGYTKAVELSNYRSDIEVVFPDGDEGEFFMSFGSLYACGEWIDTVERLL